MVGGIGFCLLFGLCGAIRSSPPAFSLAAKAVPNSRANSEPLLRLRGGHHEGYTLGVRDSIMIAHSFEVSSEILYPRIQIHSSYRQNLHVSCTKHANSWHNFSTNFKGTTTCDLLFSSCIFAGQRVWTRPRNAWSHIHCRRRGKKLMKIPIKSSSHTSKKKLQFLKTPEPNHAHAHM
jgi:hypothetical protein